LSKHLDYDDHYQTHFEQDLAETLQDNLTEGQTEDDARRLAHRCAMNESDAVDKVNQILDDTGWDMDRILNSAKTRKAEELAQDYLQRKPGAISAAVPVYCRESGTRAPEMQPRVTFVEMKSIALVLGRGSKARPAYQARKASSANWTRIFLRST